MAELTTSNEQAIQKPTVIYKGGSSDSVYGLGFIGALVYYIGQAKTFQEGLAGFFKAIVWPAILVYEVMKLLQVGQAANRQERPESGELTLEQ